MREQPRTSLLICRHCSQPLDALSRRLERTHCNASACRQGWALELAKQRWKALAALAAQRALQQTPQPGDRAPVVLWLRSASRELAPVSDAQRQALAQAWRRGAEEGWRHAYAGVDSAQAVPAAAHTLCAQCAGACCAHGAHHHAFIDADVLLRWQAAHPGSSTEDAVAAFLAHLPEAHVAGSCAFHTATGCTLPREIRADVCNRYVCDPLRELGALVQDDPEQPVVALTRGGGLLERAAVLQHGRVTPLTDLPQPDELMPSA